MPDFDNLTAQDKENLKEMLEFWTWIRGLNKVLKWLAFIGIPVAVGIWALSHYNKGN